MFWVTWLLGRGGEYLALCVCMHTCVCMCVRAHVCMRTCVERISVWDSVVEKSHSRKVMGRKTHRALLPLWPGKTLKQPGEAVSFENEEGTAEEDSSLTPLLPLPRSVILGELLFSLCLVYSSIR